MIGGKWTTYRKMGEDAVDKAIEVGDLRPEVSKTKDLSIHGSMKGLDWNDHLYFYGSDRDALLALANENPDWGKQLHPKYDYLHVEVIWAVRHEMARTVEDVLARRIRLLFLDAKAAIEAVPLVAKLMAEELKKDVTWKDEQIASFTKLAQAYLLH
jgi:glycerol-3-phosphate dehydrogenase